MHIVVFGAGGTVGQRIICEALLRGHLLGAGTRRGPPASLFPCEVKTFRADAADSPSVANAVRGADAVVCAIGPAAGEEPATLVDATRGLIAGMLDGGATRLVIVGSAATIEVRPGVDYASTIDLPDAWKPTIAAQRRVLGLVKSGSFPDLQWTYVSPPAKMEPGDRTGRYRLGPAELDASSLAQSAISTEDFAVAIVDEVERGLHMQSHVAVRR